MLGWFLFLRSFMSLVAMLLFFFLMIRRPPRSTLFPTRRSSDLVSIHDGIDTFSGEPVEANVFSNASGGVCLVVGDRKSTRLNSSHGYISYAVFCLKKKKTNITHIVLARSAA